MKKAVSLLLTIIMLINVFAVCAFTAEQNYQTENDMYVEDIGDISLCSYDMAKKTVTIRGTINHDIMVNYIDYKIAVFRIPAGKTVYDVIYSPNAKPLSSADISVRFEFTVKADTSIEVFSGYAVLIYKDNDFKLIGEPRYPGVDTNYTYTLGDKNAYKGISSELTSTAADIGAGVAIVPVYFEKLLSESATGYIYSLQGSYIYFDKSYITELDKKIKSYHAVGAKVYLQFLISDGTGIGIHTVGDPSSQNLVPDMNSQQTITLVSSFADFLCDRYRNDKNGKISGIILGREVDAAYPKSKLISEKDYSFNYAHYMLTVACASRSIISNLDIVMPLSDVNSYDMSSKKQAGLAPSDMLEAMCGLFDEYSAGKFVFSCMIESSSIPYGITDENIAKKSFSTGGYDGINADNINVFSNYLESLESEYHSTPESFIFSWIVPDEISGNVLSCAYSYSYYKMLSNNRLSSFVVSFIDNERKGKYQYFDEISRIMKYIDTKDSKITDTQKELLGIKEWNAVIDNMYMRKLIHLQDRGDLLSELEIKGDYTYYDFKYYTDISTWFGGNLCDSLKIAHNDITGRSLEAHFSGERRTPSEYAEIYCLYEYPENYELTPYMSLKFSIQNDNNLKGELYEVRFTIGYGNNVSEIKKVCAAYEQTEILFDLSSFSKVSNAKFLKISVRNLGADEGGFSFCFSSMKGFSTEKTSSELEKDIADKRLEIRNEHHNDTQDDSKGRNTMLIVAGVAIIIAVIGVGLFMCFRKEDDE